MRFIQRSVFALMLAAPLAAQAAWPEQPVRIVVGYSPGGTTDILARALGEQLSERLGQPVLIENKAGAAGSLGAALVQQASPDGHTLFMATVASHGINPSLYRKTLPYKPEAFEPVGMVASIPLMLITTPGFAPKTVGQLLDLASEKPGSLNYSSSGNGSPGHLAAAMFTSSAGLDIVHIPYRGGAQANVAVMANALLAPKGTPAAVIERLNAAIGEAMAAPALKKRFEGEGATPAPGTPAALAATIEAEMVRWAKVVELTGIKIE